MKSTTIWFFSFLISFLFKIIIINRFNNEKVIFVYFFVHSLNRWNQFLFIMNNNRIFLWKYQKLTIGNNENEIFSKTRRECRLYMIQIFFFFEKAVENIICIYIYMFFSATQIIFSISIQLNVSDFLYSSFEKFKYIYIYIYILIWKNWRKIWIISKINNKSTQMSNY